MSSPTTCCNKSFKQTHAFWLHYHTHYLRCKVRNTLNSFAASHQGALDAVGPFVPQTPQPVCKYPLDHSKLIIYRFLGVFSICKPSQYLSVKPHGIMGQREIHCVQGNSHLIPSDLLLLQKEKGNLSKQGNLYDRAIHSFDNRGHQISQSNCLDISCAFPKLD